MDYFRKQNVAIERLRQSFDRLPSTGTFAVMSDMRKRIAGNRRKKIRVPITHDEPRACTDLYVSRPRTSANVSLRRE